MPIRPPAPMGIPPGSALAAGAFVYATPERRHVVHEAAVAEIVGMIRAKYEDEGERNFAIGKRAFEHAQWQRGNFPGYAGSDFDALMDRIRDDVRPHVTIKAASIRVADWVRCHVLRELVREQIGEWADKLSMFEYRRIASKALRFSKEDVEGSLAPGWLEFIKGVAYDRATGRRVTSDAFLSRLVETVRRLNEAKPAAEAVPASAAGKTRATARAAARANEAVTASVTDALANGYLKPEAVLGIVETVARENGLSLPASIGFDPARCTSADCDLVASTMFQAGKYAEMVRLRDRLDRMVAATEKALAVAARPHPSSIKIA